MEGTLGEGAGDARCWPAATGNNKAGHPNGCPALPQYKFVGTITRKG